MSVGLLDHMALMGPVRVEPAPYLDGLLRCTWHLPECIGTHTFVADGETADDAVRRTHRWAASKLPQFIAIGWINLRGHACACVALDRARAWDTLAIHLRYVNLEGSVHELVGVDAPAITTLPAGTRVGLLIKRRPPVFT